MILHTKKPLKYYFRILIIFISVFTLITILSFLFIFYLNPNFKPTSSFDSGIYNNEFNIELNSLIPHSEIRYSIDNRKPTKDSEIYKNPINIKSSTILRVQSFRNGNPIGKESVYSYILPNRNINLPIINLIVDHKDLFDKKKGIIPNYSKQGWYRQAQFLYYESNSKYPQVKQTGEVRVYGARSRTFPRKSFHICFDNKNLGYKIFDESINTNYDCLTIRNSGNDFNSTFMRDSLVHKITSDITDIYNQKSKSVILFLNNDYYGIYDVREPNNSNTLSLKYGGESSDYSILYHYTPNNGEIRKDSGTKTDVNFYKDLLTYVQKDLSIKENREEVEKHMDLNNYFQYQIIQTFFKNYDYLINNSKFYRFNGFLKEPGTQRDGKLRWLIYDTDVSFGFSQRADDIFYTIQGKADEDELVWPYLLFNSLMKEPTYKNMFISLYTDFLNSKLKSDILLPYVDKFSSRIDSEVPYHIKRWENFSYPFENDRDEYKIPLKSKKEWEENVEEIRDFLKIRNNQVFDELDKNFSLGGTYILKIENNYNEMGYLKINSLEIKDRNWEGRYFNSVELNIVPIAYEGYVFEKWEIDGKNLKKPVFRKL